MITSAKPFKTLAVMLTLTGTLVAAGSAQAATTTVSTPPDFSTLKPVIDREGVKVWSFHTAGNPAVSYRAITTIPASLSATTAAILDYDYLPKWVPNVRQMRLLEHNDTTQHSLVYLALAFPFPLHDRDAIIAMEASQAPNGTVTLASHSVTDGRYPPVKGMVRVVKYEGSWILRPISKNVTEVVTTGFADPAGSLPLPIVNMFVQQQPFDMLKGLRGAVSRYQHAKLSIVRDPYAE